MEEKFVIKSTFNLKKRITMVRIFMGRAYYMFLVVAAAVICFNLYLMYTGRAVNGDVQKTASLFVLMIVWALLPAIIGFIWDKTSKIKQQTVTVYADKLTVVNNITDFELMPSRFYSITEHGNYIKLGPLKSTVIMDKTDVTTGNADELAAFLRDIPQE